MKVVDILIDYIKEENDRKSKVLDFHHPEKMRNLLDLDVPDQGVNLQQLIKDCAITLKYQVRTGEYQSNTSLLTPVDQGLCYHPQGPSANR